MLGVKQCNVLNILQFVTKGAALHLFWQISQLKYRRQHSSMCGQNSRLCAVLECFSASRPVNGCPVVHSSQSFFHLDDSFSHHMHHCVAKFVRLKLVWTSTLASTIPCVITVSAFESGRVPANVSIIALHFALTSQLPFFRGLYYYYCGGSVSFGASSSTSLSLLPSE